MSKERDTQAVRVLKLVLVGLIFFAAINNTSAATIDWKGATSTDWGTASNWSSGTLPGSGDAVRIGVVSFTNQPTLKSGATTTIASLTFGTVGTITLTVNSGFTLAVTGAITQNASNGNIGTLTTTLAGAGSITGASLTIGDNSTAASIGATNTLKFVATITSLHITGNVTVNATSDSILFVGLGLNDATFSLQGGTTTIDGTILTTNTQLGLLPLIPAFATFSVDTPSGSALSPNLQLTNTAPINAASLTGSIDFYNNTGGTGVSTVYYNGTNQTVYTSTTTDLDSSPSTYQNLILSGAGTKTVGGGTLSIANDFTNSATTTDLSANNPTVTIGDNWVNSGNVTGGSGNITVTNLLQNTANTITLAGGATTVGASGIQLSGGAITAGSGTVTDNGLFQNSGGALNCGSGSLIFKGLYQNTAGSFTASTGTVYFSGASQSLSDVSTGTKFNKVTFNGTGTAVMSGTAGNFGVSSTGVLTMVSPVSLTAGTTSTAYLTLYSDTTGSATVAAIPSGSSITGFVSVQRFVQGSATYSAVTGKWVARNYRLMSSPVNEGTDASSNLPYSLNYLAAKIIITNCTSSLGTTTGNSSLYFYQEHYTPNNTSFTSGNFIGVTNISNTLVTGTNTTTDATNGSAKIYAGEGFMVYYRGDKVTHTSGSPSKTSYPYVAPESVTFSTTGNLNQGSISVVSWTGTAGLLYTTSNAGNLAVRGFNLVGNPYASSIDWSTFSNSVSTAPIYGFHVNPTVYVFNPSTSNYDSYNASTGIATGKASKILPSGQGFFVQANNTSPTLTFTETAKTNTMVTGTNLLLGTPVAQTAYNSYLRLKLVTDSINYDDMVIGFNSTSTNKYNPNEDTEFFPGMGSLQSISGISSDSVYASVKWIPFPKNNANQAIRLNVSVKKSGQYTIERTDFDAIPQIYRVWLMDKYKKDSLDIRHNTSYVFDVDLTDTASFGANRFTVVVRQDPALGVHLLDFTATKTSIGAMAVWKTENEANYTNFTIERSTDGGTTFMALGGAPSSSLGTYSFPDKNPLTGSDMYRLKIEDLNGTISYSDVVTLIYGNAAQVAKSNVNVYPNPSNGMITLAINPTNNIVTRGMSLLQYGAMTPELKDDVVINQSYSIKIINITGSVVKTSNATSSMWQDNVSSLSPGTYLIQVVNNKNKTLVGNGTFVKM